MGQVRLRQSRRQIVVGSPLLLLFWLLKRPGRPHHLTITYGYRKNNYYEFELIVPLSDISTKSDYQE